MQIKAVLTVLALVATTLASATVNGEQFVTNKCSSTVYLWEVAASSEPGPVQTIDPSWTYSSALRTRSTSGGVALKVGTTPDALWTGAPTLHLSYTNNNESIWYDLSTVFGFDPLFQGKNVSVHGTPGKNPEVPTILWPGSPQPQQVKVYNGNTNLYLVLCA